MVEKSSVNKKSLKVEVVEDERHGEIGIVDYSLPRPKADANAYEFSEEVLVGQGTFAKVYRCSLIKNGKYVSVKRLVQNKKYKSRELQIHKELYHVNIVRVFHAFFTQDHTGQTVLNIVMDFIPTSVFRIQ
jgi:serine/threonine protein kinase